MKHRSVVSVCAIAILCASTLVACGGGGDSASDDTSTTGAPGTTGTSATSGPTAALTGLPLSDDAVRTRPVLTVKVDNHPSARPQFGIDRADVIVEEKVEGGLSRFMALFQSEDADRAGPVRSLRSTDPKWLRPEGGMIAYSGGIDPVKKLLKSAGIEDLGADNHGTKYYKRRNDRPFEHSMYVNTSVMRELTPKNAKAPVALFQYLPQGQTFSGANVAPVTSVSLRMGDGVTATYFDWTWNSDRGLFVRGTEGKVHEIEGQGQIGMKNVIVQFTSYSQTQWRDRANSPVDEANVVGNGDAWILSDGRILKAKWSRPSADAVTSYTDEAGAAVKLQPGHTWVSLVPPGQSSEVR